MAEPKCHSCGLESLIFNSKKCAACGWVKEGTLVSEVMRPTIVPPMSAETWKTMEESLFRALCSGGMTILAGPDAMDAIEARAKALGIEL